MDTRSIKALEAEEAVEALEEDLVGEVAVAVEEASVAGDRVAGASEENGNIGYVI